MNTETGSNTRTKNRNLNDQKRGRYGPKKKYPTNHNDYNDLQTKQRNLNSQGKKHRGRSGKRRNSQKNGSVITIDYNEFGNDYNDMQHKKRNLSGQARKHGKGFGRKKHSKNKSYSKKHFINSKKNHWRSFRKRKNYAKNGSINNDYNEFGNDYNNGWISK